MSDATMADYDWVDEGVDEYCLTLVRGMTAADLLARLRAEPVEPVTGLGGIAEASSEAWERYNGDRLFVGVTEVAGWAVMFEENGFVGVTEELSEPLSKGTRVVSHFRNVNAVDHFYLWDDGELRIHFEPLFADQRDGPDAETLAGEMEAAGFDLSEEGDYDGHTAATWALGERLTGVRLTEELLDAAEYTCGLVTVRD